MTVKFKDIDHSYTSEVGNMISVSEFVKKFEPYVNWREKAEKKSKSLKKYEGVTKSADQILAEWENKRVKGTEAGTLLHSIKEAELVGDKVKTCPTHSDFKWSIPIDNLEDGFIYPELMIYNEEYMICGQSDKVIIENNTINIYDYKTDKSIEFKGYSNQWQDPEKMLEPINHLENCNGNRYSIKMSLYMYLLWKANKGRLKSGKIYLEWMPIDRDAEGIPILHEGKPKVIKELSRTIELPYRKKEVIAMLKTIR